MSPSVETADPSPSLGDAMDTFFAPGDAGDGSAPPAPDAGNGDEGLPAGDAPPDHPNTEVGDQAPPEAEAAPPAEVADLPEGAKLEGKSIRIDVSRWNNVYRDYKYGQEIKQFAPSLEDAKAQYLGNNDFRLMARDFKSGDPRNVDAFLDYWQRESRDGFAAMTARAIDRAPAEVRAQLADRMIAGQAEAMYQKAAESGDPNDLYKAQMFEWAKTGAYRTKDRLPTADPMARRQQELDKREAQIRQQEQGRAGEQWKTWTGDTNQAIGGELNGRIDTMLSAVKGRFENAPELYGALRNQIRIQVIQRTEGDQEWMRNFRSDFGEARRTMSAQDRQSLVQGYMAKADPILSSIAKPLINEATAILVSKNQGEHQRLAAAAGKRGPAAAGAPARKSFMPQKNRGEMSLEDKIDADMDVGLRP